MKPLIPASPVVRRLLPTPTRSVFLFGLRGTGKSTFARQAFPDALEVDLRAGMVSRTLSAEPERLHAMLDASPPARWTVIDEVSRVPAVLDIVHQRIDRDPTRRFVLTGSSARSLHRAGVNLLGGRAGRLVMSPFLAAELGPAFSLDAAEHVGMLPVVWTADDPEQGIEDYATVAVFDEVRAEARIRQLGAFTRALEQIALSQASVLSATAIAQQAEVKKSTVVDWIELLEAMFLVVRVPVFTARPSRRALAAQPKLFFADCGVALALRGNAARRAMPDASGNAREGLVYQHLAAWVASTRDARLWTWRTSSGLEVDFVIETSTQLFAIEVKRGHVLRPADRRGLLAFQDEFPDATLLTVSDAPLSTREGPILVKPLREFLMGIVPGQALVDT